MILLLMALIALLGGCKAQQPAIQQVPMRESTTVELRTIEIPGDTVVLRVPFGELSEGKRTAGVATSPSGLQLLYELQQGMLAIKAMQPIERIQYPETTTTKEIPVEVVREVEVNHLRWWQKTLMYVGVATVIWLGVRLVRRLR